MGTLVGGAGFQSDCVVERSEGVGNDCT
jgi:hypothetical protein